MERKTKGGKKGGKSRRWEEREGKGGAERGSGRGGEKSCVMAVRGMDTPARARTQSLSLTFYRNNYITLQTRASNLTLTS